MNDQRKPFKRPPKRFEPKGISILHEDHDIIVINKMGGLSMSGEHSVTQRLCDYVRKGNSKSKNRVYLVHHLAKDSSGVVILAKNMDSCRFLQEHWEEFPKTYTVLCKGEFKKEKGTITSQLTENSVFKVFSTRDPRLGEPATTEYQVIKANDKFTLITAIIKTDVKSQIRAHLSEAGHPIVGDKKYGGKEHGISLCLHSAELTFTHPFTQESLTFSATAPNLFESLIRRKR